MKICKVEGCENKHTGLGYCVKHYKKFKKYGDPLFFINKTDHEKYCKVDGCNNQYKTKGYCSHHYGIFRHHGTVDVRTRELHGMTKTYIYQCWAKMRQRCYNKNLKSYKNYGGRGITVCERWNNSFLAFLEDMGYKPTDNHELDRIDNNGNYEPSNCRWVTHTENNRNKRNTVLTEEKVLIIRKLYPLGSYRYEDIARIVKVNKSTVAGVLNNRSWREI